MAGFLPAFPIILRRLDMTDEASIGLWTGLLTAAAPFSAALSGPLWGRSAIASAARSWFCAP